MSKADIRRATMMVLFVLLAYTAPQWLAPGHAQVSAYEAPWIYPSLEPR
jgi:hypothetical protein